MIFEICRLLEIVKTRTTPYHLQSDDLVERVNRTLLSMMAMATSNHPNQWESHLRSICMAYNCSIQATIGYTPFYLMFGRQAKVLIDLMLGPHLHQCQSQKYAAQLKERLEKAYGNKSAKKKELMACSLKREKDFNDKKVHGDPFNEGVYVWLHCPAIPQGHSRTLPCSKEDLRGHLYRVQHLKNNRPVVVHFNRHALDKFAHKHNIRH